jgi:hypothetical protein
MTTPQESLLKSMGRSAEQDVVYSPTVISNPSREAEMFSQEIIALTRERRAQTPALGLPDALVAMELAKGALLSESGITTARSHVLIVAAAVLIAAVSAFVIFASQ